MQWLLRALPLSFFLSIAHAQVWDAQNEEEALFIRRIADFWQEGEYQIVKGQIEEFLKEFPNSSFIQTLSATLGDLYMREKNFNGALEQYTRISDSEISERVFLNRMHCLLELQWFATLADECERFLQKENLDADNKLQTSYLLATALYQQCVNAPKDSEDLLRLAERAKPHFELLLKSELSQEVAAAFGHLCCILKDFATASQVYLNLAEQKGFNREEMLFQAAILQAEYDKKLALKTFDEVILLAGPRAHDALYNQLILTYDTGQYAELLGKKEELLSKIPAERQSSAHLFFGRSHLQLKQYPEALQELLKYADKASSSEALRSALIDILETAYQLGDEPSLKIALQRISDQFPDDPQIPKALFAHVLLLKKNNLFKEAAEEIKILCSRYSMAPEVEAARFEEIHIDYQENNWKTCRTHCKEYLDRYPQSNFTAHVWRYLASVGFHLANESSDPSLKEELAFHLEMLLKQEKNLTPSEQNDWGFLLAKTDYELKRFEPAIKILQPMISGDSNFAERANAILLLALCERDGNQDFERFCKGAEEALALHATLLDEAALHIALFNGYLAKSPESIDLAAEHLYLASQKKDIELDNLRWLSDYYFTNSDRSLLFLQRAYESLNRFIIGSKVVVHDLNESSLPFESAIVRSAELQGRLGQGLQQLELLQSLKRQYMAHPSWAWKRESDVDLLLGTNYLQSGQTDLALQQFDQILANNPTLRSRTSAAASLQSAQIRLMALKQKNLSNEDPSIQKILTQLKTLILQKNLANEPIHLNAAIEYVDLQTSLESPEKRLEKRLALLTKVKTDFESSSDLLSCDYQNSRKVLLQKDRLFHAYMNFFDAAILYCQSKLAFDASDRFQYREKAAHIIKGILVEPFNDFLALKAREQLEQMGDK